MSIGDIAFISEKTGPSTLSTVVTTIGNRINIAGYLYTHDPIILIEFCTIFISLFRNVALAYLNSKVETHILIRLHKIAYAFVTAWKQLYDDNNSLP